MRYNAVVSAAVVIAIVSARSAHGQTLRGSRASVDLMYSAAQAEDLSFLRTPSDVYAAARAGALRPIEENDDLELKSVKYPFVLPSTLHFADSLASAYRAGCGERIVVTSGARPVDEQPRNASPKSVHPTGMAIDFRKPRAPSCLRWLRANLVTLERQHVIEATEERRPAHFHVAVLSQGPEPKVSAVDGDVVKERKPAPSKVTRHSKSARRGRTKKP